jgi:hypothetical protein
MLKDEIKEKLTKLCCLWMKVETCNARIRPPQCRIVFRMKNQLKRQWQVTRDPTLKAQVNHLQRTVSYWLNKWRNKQWSYAPEFLNSKDQSLWKMTKRVM